MYCANELSGTLSVIDAAADTVLTTIPGLSWVSTLCYSSRYNRVYCSGESAKVVVIDAAADTVLHSIDVGFSPLGLEYNAKNDKVYALLGYFPALGVVVIDAAADTVRARLDLGVSIG